MRVIFILSATSEYIRRFSEDFRTLAKMYEDVPTTFEHFPRYYKTTIFELCDTVKTQGQQITFPLYYMKVFLHRGHESNCTDCPREARTIIILRQHILETKLE